MPRSRRIAALAVTFLAISLIALPASARSGRTRLAPVAQSEQSTILNDGISRELYDNDALFAQLSSAKQRQLEHYFGPKIPRRSDPDTDSMPYPLNVASKLAVADVLVNNPATDTTQFTQSETSCLVAGTNVVVAFNDSGSDTSGSNHFTGYALSTDGGATFTDKGVLPASTAGDAGDPVLARDNTSGNVYMSTLGFSSGNLIQFWKSTDGGQTFLAPVNCTPGNRATDSMDKEWITVDNFAGPGQGNIYHFWRNFGGGSAGNGMRFTRSTDAGATWGPTRPWVTIEASAGQGAFPVVGPDHAVYCFWLSTGNVIKVRKSTDQGVTFGLPTNVYTCISTGVNGDLGLSPGFRSNTFPQAVVNPTNANQIFMTLPDKGTTPDKANVFLFMSTDGGSTWSAPTQVNDDGTTTDQWQPSLAISPDGTRLFVGYYSRQNDPGGNNLIDSYCRVGTVSPTGVTFDPSQRLSSVSFPPAFGHDPVVNGVYMGDYDHTTADATSFYRTWGDNRNMNFNNTRNQPDVYFAKVAVGQAGPGADTLGVVDTASASYFLRNSNSAGNADIAVNFGAAGFTPLHGDWDGNGVDTVGAYDPATGNFFLRNSNTPGNADLTFQFGVGGAGIIPLSGDWDGNGTDTIGIYDTATGNFFLRNANSAGNADLVFQFGVGGAGIVPLAGDWDGDGTDTIGLYDPAAGVFFLRNANSAGNADLTVFYGAAGSVPIVGDFDGNGSDTIATYVPGTAVFFLRNSNTPGNADITINYGGPNLVPMMGDWDGL